MEPTLNTNDFLLFENFSINNFSGNIILNRGDIIAFHNPRDKKDLKMIKRTIGLPRETVIVATNSVKIIHLDNTEEIFDKNSDLEFGEKINGKNSTTILGKEDYFVLGDNRLLSEDSREFGTVQPSEMLGKYLLNLSTLPFMKYLQNVLH